MKVGDFWYEATRDVEASSGNIRHSERYDMIERVQERCQAEFFWLDAAFYRAADVIASADNLKYITAAGAFTAATKVLSGTWNVALTSGDVGKFVAFRVGSTGYVATVEAMISTTEVQLRSTWLPGSDQSVDDGAVYPTLQSLDGMVISSLPILYAAADQIRLESTLTDDVRPMTYDDLLAWNGDHAQNKYGIAWCLFGPNILMRLGAGLTSYGSLVLRYVRLPHALTNDEDDVDLPSGPRVQIGIVVLKAMLRERYSLPKVDYSPELQRLVGNLLAGKQVMRTTEQIKQISEALLQ